MTSLFEKKCNDRHASGYTASEVEPSTTPYPHSGVDRISDSLPSPMFSYRLEADGVDCFPWVNDAFARLCGTEAAQLAKTAAPLLRKIHPDDRADLQELFRDSALTLKPLGALFRFYRQFEGERWLKLCAVPEQREMDSAIEWRGVLTDVVVPKRVELNDDNEDNLSQLLLELSRDGLMLLDMDGRVREANESMSRMLGYSRDELRQLHLWDFEAQWSRDELLHRIRADDLGNLLFESVLRRKDGALIDVEVSRTVVDRCGERLLYENFREISEHKQAELAAYEQVHFLQQLLDTIPIPVFYKNSAGRYLNCNKAFERLTALPRDEIIGKTVHDLFPKVLADAYHEAEEAMYHGKGEQIYESSIQVRDGTKRDVIFNKATFSAVNGKISGIVGAAIDITERKKLEAELAHVQKMEAVGQLAGGIAHDFNNILTAIIGFASLVEMKAGGASPLVPHLRQITHAAERGAALTQDLLSFSRKREMDLRPVDLDEVIANARDLMTRMIREDICLTISRSERPLTVLADDSQLTQVLLNLAVNARDAMPQGGRITVATSSFLLEQDYLEFHAFGKPGRYALITFSDTGCGMDEKKRKRIFEPFFTSKETGKGTGLGLSIVYGIVSQLEGFITVSSELGVGTVLRIYLPEFNELPVPEETIRQDTPISGGSETVLLAEDDPVVLELEELLLSEAGYTVITANDGEEAIAIFRERGESIDLLVLDAVMPGKSGLEVIREARDMRPEVSAIIMSGYATEGRLRKGFIRRGVTH
ncbi:MAG: PAS domain S-box protein [Deltaproteobacteria bacterium]|nr:PAS domain S-box protein [Deltaproteobacteria bacterium]